MTPFAWLFRASLLLAVALIAERTVGSLRLRRLLLLAGAAGALVLPLLAFEIPIPTAVPSVSAEQVIEWVGISQPTAPLSAEPTGAPAAARGESAVNWGLLVWGLGSLVLALRALAGRLWLARAVWRARPAPDAWQQGAGGAPLRISDSLQGAGLAGPWPRAVLLPRAAAAWSPSERAQVVRHEQAHAQARDDWSLLLTQALTVALWPTPLSWWVQRRARLVAELAADDAVVAAGASPIAYAETLARLAGAARPGLVAASTPGVLEVRVRALLSGRPREARGTLVSLAAAGAALLTIALAGVPGTAVSGTLAATPLQAAVDAELARLEATWHPKGAAIVVVDAEDGTLLASGDMHGARDQPLELGSVLKPFTVAAALEAGTPADTVLPGHGGRWSVGAATIQDHRAAEAISLTELLAWSSNVGAALLVEEVGVEAVRAALRSVGVAAPAAEDHTLAAAHLGMGVNVPVSPAQLAQAYTAFSSDSSPFQPATIATVREGLAAAIGPEGTARAAAVPGALGGKTGTAAHGEGYVASFAGLWAAPQGTAVVVVVVVEPQTDRPYGGAVAAPAFARLLAAGG